MSIFLQIISILVTYFLSAPRMLLGQTYQFVKELVSDSYLYIYSMSQVIEVEAKHIYFAV